MYAIIGGVLGPCVAIILYFFKRFVMTIDRQVEAFQAVQDNNDKAFRDLQREISAVAQKVAKLEGRMDA